MKDLTIVLTLYDRGGYYEYPKRWMEFAKKHLSMFKILVADGSGKKEIKSYFTDKKNFNDIDLLYLEYPKDNTYRDYFAKLNNSINKVDTKYTTLADDDDFYYSEGLLKSIEFLDNNNDFVTCRGLVGTFKLSNSKKLKIKYINIPKGGPSLDNSNPIERYKFSFQKTNIKPIYYDVHRSELQKNNFKILHEPNFIEPIMVEMLPQSLDVIQGKIGRINELYLMRQTDQNNSAHKQYVEKSGDVLHRLCFGDFSNDLKIWADILSKDLSKIMNIEKKTSYEIVTNVFKAALRDDHLDSLDPINKFKKSKNNFFNLSNHKRILTFLKNKIFLNTLNDNDEKIIFNNEFLSQINNHLKGF